MAKKQKNKETQPKPQHEGPKLTPEMEEKLKNIKSKIDHFKKKVIDKFGDYIVGISLLPPENKEEKKDIVNVLVLVDDTTSEKMSKEELHEKFSAIIGQIAKETDEHLTPQSVLLTELWQNCYDGKYDLLKLIALGAQVHDTGMLSAIKIAEIHKTMILKKFEKYIVNYVLAGSLVQGKATPESDIDVWIVIDDTDVKKMTRAELKDKLRAIIIGMGIEAGEMTGIKNKLNIQVYILTEFWDSLKEANPIIFTLLRDGVPFYDRGMFMPWKLMLKMGKIKPSREAIDMFMSTGDQMLNRVKGRIKDMAMEDIYYAILTPSQAALMLYGIPPPTPRETPEVMKSIFVDKEKILEPEYIKILEHNVKIRKDVEHGTKKELTGKEIDELIKNAEKYLKRIQRLFKQIEKTHEEESIVKIYDEIITVIRDVLKLEGIEKAQDEEIIKLFEDELIAKGKIPARYLRNLNEIVDAKNDYDKGKLTKAEIEKARSGSSALLKFLIEYIQRKRGREMERA
ncbi:MAG: nucleotidyltransferase domain-containing protein, partial [Candidatus Woesearchaeota archaeon]